VDVDDDTVVPGLCGQECLASAFAAHHRVAEVGGVLERQVACRIAASDVAEVLSEKRQSTHSWRLIQNWGAGPLR